MSMAQMQMRRAPFFKAYFATLKAANLCLTAIATSPKAGAVAAVI